MIEHNSFYLYLIRHGQSEVNIQPDMVGQSGESRLTDKGKDQAALLGERLFRKEKLSADYVFSSDYRRAAETCSIATSFHPIVVAPSYHAELREYSAGDWTGGSRKEIYNTLTLLRMAAMNNGFLPPNGESMHQVERRASRWLEDTVLYNEEFIRKAALGDKPNVFVFSHGMTIKCLLHYIMGFDQSFTWKVTLENTSISKLYFGAEGWRLLSINDHAHLL